MGCALTASFEYVTPRYNFTTGGTSDAANTNSESDKPVPELFDLLKAMEDGNLEKCFNLVTADAMTQVDITPQLVDEIVRIVAESGAKSITSVGCGTGLFEFFLAKKLGKTVFGIEPGKWPTPLELWNMCFYDVSRA
jgi:ubiquinone/menaquinone biosynthesis C-methylase UbiE